MGRTTESWRWKLESGSQQDESQLRIPELELSIAVRIFKDRYSVFLEPVEKKPYYVRFRQLQTTKTIQGMTHGRGTLLSPRFVMEILTRFGIEPADFLEGLVESKKGPQRV